MAVFSIDPILQHLRAGNADQAIALIQAYSFSVPPDTWLNAKLANAAIARIASPKVVDVLRALEEKQVFLYRPQSLIPAFKKTLQGRQTPWKEKARSYLLDIFPKHLPRLPKPGLGNFLQTVYLLNPDAAANLVGAGLPIDAPTTPHRSTLLHTLVSSKATTALQVERWLDLGANVHVYDRFGATPLHWACSSGQAPIVKLLLSRDADVHVKDKEGFTPALRLMRLGSLEAVQAVWPLLKAQGARLTERTQDNRGVAELVSHSSVLDWLRPELAEMEALTMEDETPGVERPTRARRM